MPLVVEMIRVSRLLTERSYPAARIAMTVTAVFVLIGLIWVMVSDIILYRYTHDIVLVAQIETAKGWGFVGLSGALLFTVTFLSALLREKAWRLTGAMLESIGDGVLLLGNDRRIEHANPAAVRMLETPFEQLVGMGAEEFVRKFRVSYPNGALVAPSDLISQRVYDEGGPLHYKAVLRRGDGRELVIGATAAAVRWRDGAPAKWVVSILRDITEVENLDRLRDQLFAAAAHSLKTPVAIIKANAQKLETVATAPQRSLAASLERQSDRIDRLVQNLLVMARDRSGTLELHQVEIALDPLIEQIAAEAVWSFRHAVSASVSSPLRVFADEERLALVIRNLMHEASRLSPPDTPISVQAVQDGAWVDLIIHYQPLEWREDASDFYDRYDDIGIGRSVSSSIVRAHGGTLDEHASDTEVVLRLRLPAAGGGA
jgi:signal transduction histidine kinase